MSSDWQPYIDSSLVGSGHIEKAAIISAAGDSLWAASNGFNINATEMKEIASAMKGSKTDLYDTGLHIAGVKYIPLRAVEGRSVYLRNRKQGVILVKTKLAILVGYYGETIQAGNAATTVEALADYLIQHSS